MISLQEGLEKVKKASEEEFYSALDSAAKKDIWKLTQFEFLSLLTWYDIMDIAEDEKEAFDLCKVYDIIY
jgi:hypothetical protein